MIPSFTKICKYFLHIRFNPFRTQEMRFFEKKNPKYFLRRLALVLVGMAPEIDLSYAEFYALSNGS